METNASDVADSGLLGTNVVPPEMTTAQQTSWSISPTQEAAGIAKLHRLLSSCLGWLRNKHFAERQHHVNALIRECEQALEMK